jgi:hypothetical protein
MSELNETMGDCINDFDEGTRKIETLHGFYVAPTVRSLEFLNILSSKLH